MNLIDLKAKSDRLSTISIELIALKNANSNFEVFVENTALLEPTLFRKVLRSGIKAVEEEYEKEVAVLLNTQPKSIEPVQLRQPPEFS